MDIDSKECLSSPVMYCLTSLFYVFPSCLKTFVLFDLYD